MTIEQLQAQLVALTAARDSAVGQANYLSGKVDALKEIIALMEHPPMIEPPIHEQIPDPEQTVFETARKMRKG